MRIGLLTAATLASCSLALAQNGWGTPECPGIVVSGDFNADGCDDVLVLGIRGPSRTYYGQKAKPYFKAGPQWFREGFMSLGDVPLFVGKHLYLPIRDAWTRTTRIQIYSHKGTLWTADRTVYLTTKSTSAKITSVKITGLGKDVNKDKLEDIMVVWAQSPLTTSAAYYAAYVSPSGIHKQLTIPKPTRHHRDALVADVHLSHSLTKPKAEFVVTLSAPYRALRGGFGFLILKDGPTIGKTVWVPNASPLDNGGLSPSNSACAYGHFGLMPQLGAPLIKLDRGESILFEPWFVAPYVRNRGEVLYSARTGTILDSCTADYDGDGVDEIVLMEHFGIWKPSLLYIGDPSTKRPYVQAINLWTDRRYTSPYVFHGTKGDFNGDGLLDLMLSYSRGENSKEIGYSALWLGNRSDGPKKAALRRVH
ncbi:MAG: VCBS repeat-containing protein [Planctomycetota bacterium]